MLKSQIKSKKYVHIVYIIIIISLFITSTLLIIPNLTSAVSYQSSNNIEFNLNPTISISITGGDLSIANLVPGSVSDSNTIDVTVASNAISGYTLSSTVGATGNLSNELRKDGTDTTNKFVNLTANQTALSGFSDNEWGYSYSTDNGSTWISGDIDSSSSGYNGYTYTTESQSITHLNTSTPSSSTIQYKIGAKASNTQLAGNYTNAINFIALANSNPMIMQDVTLATCPTTATTAIDIRDGSAYKIQKLADNKCWMLDNLALNPTTVSLDALKGRTNASDTTLNYLKNGGGSSPYTNYATSSEWTSSEQNYYDRPMINADSKNIVPSGDPSDSYGSNKVGIYYNYCAASAGSYCYVNSSSSGNASEDLCPAGWRMPYGSSSGEYQALYAAYSNTAIDVRRALSIPFSGNFFSGSGHYRGSNGNFWSLSRYDNTHVHILYVDSAGIYPAGNLNRDNGVSIRCIIGN